MSLYMLYKSVFKFFQTLRRKFIYILYKIQYRKPKFFLKVPDDSWTPKHRWKSKTVGVSCRLSCHVIVEYVPHSPAAANEDIHILMAATMQLHPFFAFFAEIKKLSPHKKLTKSRGNICESFYGGDDGGLFNMHSVCLMEIWLKPWRKQATKATLTHTHTQKGRASTAAADRKAKRTRQDYAKARQKLFDVWTPREINWQHKTKSSARAWDWEKGKGRENRRKNWKNRIAGKQIKRPAAIYWCSAHAPPTSSVLQFCSSFPRELGKIF